MDENNWMRRIVGRKKVVRRKMDENNWVRRTE